MRRLKILHVGIDENLGGIETYLLKISSHFDFQNFHFDFLSFKGSHPCFMRELSSLGCGFKFITGRRENYFRSRKELRELLEAEKYDIIHCHLNSLSYIDPALVGLKVGSKVIVHSRNAGSATGSSNRYLCFINKFLLPYDKVVKVAVSDKAGKWMFGENRKCLVLNNGVDTDKFCFSEVKRNEFRKELGISDDREIIVHVGAFRPQKNHSFLIDVFSCYQKAHKESLLLLVGEGELKNEIEEKVESLGIGQSVLFLGQRLDLEKVLSGSDKFLFPSLYEGFPNALLEAEASGLLCVVSDEITRQTCLANSIALSLRSPVEVWSKALGGEKCRNRESYSKMVESKGYGIKGEIERLELLYRRISDGEM